MKGDFSNLQFRPTDNFTGALYQQGRAFSDQDGNASDAIGRHLRQLLGRDTIGPGVAAVPIDLPDSLKVLAAETDGVEVRVTVNPGRVWVDGLHLYVPGDNGSDAPVVRTASYFGPPIASPTPTAGDIDAGRRDAMVLETWETALSAFQAPGDLLEPALGGPDTSERVILNHRLRLLRLAEGEDCSNLERMADTKTGSGRLTVTAAPTLSITGDCPVQGGGGYTGFEHFLYRIEIAEPGPDGARFKFSRFNGGLVGRGVFNETVDQDGNAVKQILIRANNQMINLSQLGEFYVEVLTPGPLDDPGHWQVAMTATAVSQEGGDILSLGDDIDGNWPGPHSDEMFFRLWDGLRNIEDFLSEGELEQGIELTFDAPSSDLGNYRPGDFWAFPVRAAGVELDPSTWPTDALPQGVCYHRAPLAVLNWDAPVTRISDFPAIEDCRDPIQPRTRHQGCCRYQVGDGRESFGDFDSIQAAVDQLPPEGGEICVLAGTFTENVVIDKDNVRIHGCGPESRVAATGAGPAFQIVGRRNVRISDLFVSADAGACVLVAAGTNGLVPEGLLLQRLELEAATNAAIRVLNARDATVRDCQVRMLDRANPSPAVYLRAEDALFEHNTVSVIDEPPDGFTTRGGIQIAGTSERIRVIDNLLEGGSGNGITLGTLVVAQEDEPQLPEIILGSDILDNLPGPGDILDGLPGPGGVLIPPPDLDVPELASEGALYDIRIERNRIRNMGLAGIGVVGYFDLDEQDEFVSVVGLDILGNEITGCLTRELLLVPEQKRDFAGYGAIALADVEHLRVHDNCIENNGGDHQFPVCGLFVVHAEGADVSRNRIINTGAKSDVSTSDALAGKRGGIVILFAVPPMVPLQIGQITYPRQGGEPAARVHDNIVSQPLGQALFLQALGPVSVRGNQLTTRGLIMRTEDPSFWAAAVWIMNLGVSNELYFQSLLFSGPTADPLEPGTFEDEDEDFLPAPRPGMDDFAFGQYLANGNVSFSDNQVLTDLMEFAGSFAVSSVLIVSLDDIQVQDNQLDCEFFIDVLFTNLMAAGMTVRINNNRFKESLIFAPLSWMALGLVFSNTSDNQSTHCFLNLHSPLGSNNPFLETHIAAHDNQVLYPFFGAPRREHARCKWVTKYEDLLLPKGAIPPTQVGGPPAHPGFDFPED